MKHIVGVVVSIGAAAAAGIGIFLPGEAQAREGREPRERFARPAPVPRPSAGRGPRPASNGSEPGSAAGAEAAQDVDVRRIKDRYWARGDESELGVVQNRTYSKAGKLELAGFGGIVHTDPFLDVKLLGGSLGYHFSEYLSAHAVGWGHFVSKSSALNTFEATRGATANTNEPRSFAGGELVGSILYGKLSLLGKSILYYDFHLRGGLGLTSTETGRYVTPYLGVGQQVYLSRRLTLKVDYRLMVYKEDIEEKVIPTRIGQKVDERTNWSGAITLGLGILIGG